LLDVFSLSTNQRRPLLPSISFLYPLALFEPAELTFKEFSLLRQPFFQPVSADPKHSIFQAPSLPPSFSLHSSDSQSISSFLPLLSA
jgi:hypothetical protein